MHAEKSVLGTMMKAPYLLNESRLGEEHFDQAYHKAIFKGMKELQGKGKGVDLVSLITYFDPKTLGGANYVSELINFSDEKKFDSHQTVVLDSYREREKKRIVTQAQFENWDIDTILSELDKLQDDEVNDHHDIMNLTLDIYEAPYQPKDIQKGVDTGMTKLNQLTSGLQNSELTILAARPSMGKTDVMLHIAKNAGWNNYLPIIFSLEMSSSSLRDRLVASTGGYNRSKMKDPHGTMTDGQKESWIPTIHKVGDTKIQIFDRSGQTLPEIRMKVRKMANQFKERKPIILIDYLTLIKSIDKTDNMHQKVGNITKGLKAMAKEFDCPVVVLAQLSRQVEQRQDKRPMLSDLRESGSIEEDADVVMFLYREAYYSKETNDRTLEINVAKNRNGATGTVLLEYNSFTGNIEG